MTSNDKLRLELSGMVDNSDEFVAPWSMALSEGLEIPSAIDLVGNSLEYHLPRPGESTTADPGGALDRFVRLRDGHDVLRYARRYGVLGLAVRGPKGAELDKSMPPEEGYPVIAEPIEAWLRLSRRMDALQRLAASLHIEETTLTSDWALAFEDTFDFRSSGQILEQLPVFPLTSQRKFFAGAFEIWLQAAHVRMRFTWEDENPRLELAGDLFGTLVIQMAAAVTRTSGPAVCSGCGNAYSGRQRRPQRGRRNYCEDCKNAGVPARDAQSDRRAGRSRTRTTNGLEAVALRKERHDEQ